MFFFAILFLWKRRTPSISNGREPVWQKKMILEPETIYFNAMWVKISLVPVTLTFTKSSGLIDLFASRIKHYY